MGNSQTSKRACNSACGVKYHWYLCSTTMETSILGSLQWPCNLLDVKVGCVALVSWCLFTPTLTSRLYAAVSGCKLMMLHVFFMHTRSMKLASLVGWSCYSSPTVCRWGWCFFRLSNPRCVAICRCVQAETNPTYKGNKKSHIPPQCVNNFKWSTSGVCTHKHISLRHCKTQYKRCAPYFSVPNLYRPLLPSVAHLLPITYMHLPLLCHGCPVTQWCKCLNSVQWSWVSFR